MSIELDTPAPSVSNALFGVVVSVVDGDTIRVDIDGVVGIELFGLALERVGEVHGRPPTELAAIWPDGVMM